jgi:hypothetical protein
MFGFAILMPIVNFFTRIGYNEAWNDLAKQTGLIFKPATFFDHQRAVFGVYRQRQIRLETFEERLESFDRSSATSTYTRIVVLLNQPTNLSMTIQEVGMLNRIGEALGMKDVQIGDEDLDRRFNIQGQPQNEVVRLLSIHEVRKRLWLAFDLNIKVEGQVITYKKYDVEINPDTLIGLFDLLCLLADEIDHLQHPEVIS